MTAQPQVSADQPRRILMTRGQDACARYAAQLFPLADRLIYFTPLQTRARVLTPEARAHLLAATQDDATAFVVTSARALEALQSSNAELVASLRHCVFFAVGEATAEVLRTAGFAHVVAGAGDIATLAALIALQAPQKNISRLIHLAGDVTVADLADVMRATTLSVETHVVYETDLLPVPAELAADLASGAVSDVIMLSARVAEHIGAAIVAHPSPHLPAIQGPQRVFCLSQRIADAVRTAFAPAAPELIVAPRPDVAALLTMIDASAAPLHNIQSDNKE